MTFQHLLSRVLYRLCFPVLPASRRLPFRSRMRRLDGSAEPELELLATLTPERHVAVDVGANYGLYALRMAQLFAEVHAFEINDELTGELRAANPGNVTIHPVGLSSEAGAATLHIPVRRGIPLPGWASLTPGNCPETAEHLTRAVTIQTLDHFRLARVSFLKIDVEGHELHVLRGGERTLREGRPTVLVEVRDANRAAVSAFFEALGYADRTETFLPAAARASGNRFFAPAEAELPAPDATRRNRLAGG